MRDIYDTSVKELGSALSQELREELDRITLPFGTEEIPSEAELRVAQAQLVGWLEGLILWSLICFPVFDLLDVTPDLALVDGSDSVKIL